MRDRHGSSRENRGLPGAQIALAIRTGEAVPRAAAPLEELSSSDGIS